jgi:hypothetical protein
MKFKSCKLEKELISLDMNLFERIEDYLVHAKDLHLKLGKCEKNFHNKYGQLIKLVPMNIRTHFNFLCSTFLTNW